MGSFVFKWPHPNANDVHVTGTFDDWSKSEQLNKVGEFWEKEVQLSQADKKILYKFVVDDHWTIDTTAPQEDDGHGNLNNVLHPEQIKVKGAVVPEAVTTSSAAPETTTAALAGAVPLEPKKEASEVGDSSLAKDIGGSSPPGAFPATPQQEPDSFAVNPLPATSGDANPINVPAGEKLPPASDVTASAIDSKVTTSKEDYENAGQEPASFSVNPIPASAGPGNPVDLTAGEKLPDPSQVSATSVHSTVTTSKEDYEKAGSSIPFIGGALASIGLIGGGAAAVSASNKHDNLIPESSLPMGADAGKALDAGPTVSSAAPTSTTAGLAGIVPLEERKEASVIDPQTTTDSVPEVVKDSIAAAHTSPEATTSAEAVKEKAEVEQELLKKVHSSDEAGEPAPTLGAATSATAPAVTSPSDSAVAAPAATLGTTSSAAAAVADGTDASETPPVSPQTKTTVEKTEGDNTEYAPPHASGSAPGVSPSAAAALSDGTEDPTLLDEPAVQYLKQNDAAAADATANPTETKAADPESKAGDPVAVAIAAPSTGEAPKEAPKAETTRGDGPEPKSETPETSSAATTTPKKAATTTPTASPATGSATKEKKKKHRISSLFKKIFD